MFAPLIFLEFYKQQSTFASLFMPISFAGEETDTEKRLMELVDATGLPCLLLNGFGTS
jgi:hypothetical protein